MTTAVRSPSTVRHRALVCILFSLAGIALNLVLRRLAALIGIPLYLDCVGTVLTAILGGYLPGMLVGYLTNIFLGIWDPYAIYYGMISVLIAAAAAYLARQDRYRTVGRSLRTAPWLALIGGGLGSILTFGLYGLDFGEELSAKLAHFLYDAGLRSVFCAQLIGDFLIDLADKLLVVIIVILLLHFIPQGIQNTIRHSFWQQRILTEEERKTARRFRVRRMSLRQKFLMLISGAMLVVALVTAVICFRIYRDTLIETRTEFGRSITRVMASYFDPDKVDEYLAKGEAVPGYTDIDRQMAVLRDNSEGVSYVYVYRILPDGCHVVFDPDTMTEAGSDPGDIVAFDEDFKSSLADLLNGRPVEPITSNASWGWLISIYTPVEDSSGRVVCYACADISMDKLLNDQYVFFTKVFSLFVTFTAIVLAFFLLLADARLILPINTMAMASSRFAFDSESKRNAALEYLRSLGIHTGDEIENLYGAIAKTTEDSVRYIDEAQQKSETIARMQENLILVLADMVESRDQFTGDHVKNTSAYARIIMEQMKKEGSYSDQLTDEFMDNVYHSAPLHDIGKIRISDTILNKPGKLTDEEFEIMKLHTVYGKEVIEKAKKASSDISYLNEAENLATYHHEKWNGKGYPTGLSGEEIPLSARIMAVADVFDALVSKRSYKDPFPFEKAMDIIREGSGSHFDPKVADAFIHAEEEVRKVLAEKQSEK